MIESQNPRDFFPALDVRLGPDFGTSAAIPHVYIYAVLRSNTSLTCRNRLAQLQSRVVGWGDPMTILGSRSESLVCDPHAGWGLVACNSCRRLVLAGLIVSLLGISCVAQDSFSVRNEKREKWPEEEARRIYIFASQAVQREFNLTKAFRPHFTLVLGSQKDQLDVNTNELRLVKWNKHFFAEGVVLFAFEQMLPSQKKTELTNRALAESDAMVNVQESREANPSPP